MKVSSTDDFEARVPGSYDRMSELKAFDDTKAGVKGIVDAEMNKVSQIFILQPKYRAKTCATHISFSVMDLKGIDKDPIKYKDIVDKF